MNGGIVKGMCLLWLASMGLQRFSRFDGALDRR